MLFSIEWYYSLSFLADIFSIILKIIDIKFKVIERYSTELKEYSYLRSLKGIKLIAKYQGMKANLNYEEDLKVLNRIIKWEKLNS